MESKNPNISHYIKKIQINEDSVSLVLFVVEFQNAIFVSVYDDEPKLGSFSQGFSVEGLVQQNTIFLGKHNQFTDALVNIFAKKTGKVVYGSVNFTEKVSIDITNLKSLIDLYFNPSV